MTTLNVNTIKPAGATLTLGESGDSVVLVDDVKVNLVKDAGANTLWSSNGSGVLSLVKAGLGGADKLISSQTFTGETSVSFTSGIDSSYKEYIFKFIHINPTVKNARFAFQVNAVGQTGYNETITSTMYQAYHSEGGSSHLGWDPAMTQAQGTGYQPLGEGIGNDADACFASELHLFNPGSTTYVKNFYARSEMMFNNDYNMSQGLGGYINTAAAIDDIDFKISSGSFDGTIKMYGIAS